MERNLLVLYQQGDDQNPLVRARLVAQETKRVSTMDPNDASATFAATPPLEALRFTLSLVKTGPQRRHADALVLGFSGISRAHVHGRDR